MNGQINQKGFVLHPTCFQDRKKERKNEKQTTVTPFSTPPARIAWQTHSAKLFSDFVYLTLRCAKCEFNYHSSSFLPAALGTANRISQTAERESVCVRERRRVDGNEKLEKISTNEHNYHNFHDDITPRRRKVCYLFQKIIIINERLGCSYRIMKWKSNNSNYRPIISI
jgi:hypothetical protein